MMKAGRNLAVQQMVPAVNHHQRAVLGLHWVLPEFLWYLDVLWHLLNGLDWNLDGLPLVGVLWHLDNALLRALDDLDDIAELLTWLVDVLGDKRWEQGAR